MPRTSSNRSKRGITQRSVAKHKVRAKIDTISLANDVNSQDDFSKAYKRTLFQLSSICPEILYKLCSKLFLIPLTRNGKGLYIELDGKALGIHRFVVFVGLEILAQKSWVTIQFLCTQHLNIVSFMCICEMLAYITTFCTISGFLFKTKETVDLMNFWPMIIDGLKTTTEKDVQALGDVSTALKIIIVSTTNQAIPMAAIMISLLFSTLPVCRYPTLKNIGLIPDGIMSTFDWQLISAPFEYLTYMPPMLVTAFAGDVFVMGLGVLKTYVKHRRALPVNDMATRKILERLYICMELHNRVFSVWFRFVVVPTMLSMVAFVIMARFMTIRYTQLPLFFYIMCPYVGVLAMGVIFWVCYDAILMQRDAEDVMQKLQSDDSSYLQGEPKAIRTNILKRSKALKRLEFLIGYFGEFSLALPVIIREETLNQVLFLLSL